MKSQVLLEMEMELGCQGQPNFKEVGMHLEGRAELTGSQPLPCGDSNAANLRKPQGGNSLYLAQSLWAKGHDGDSLPAASQQVNSWSAIRK